MNKEQKQFAEERSRKYLRLEKGKTLQGHFVLSFRDTFSSGKETSLYLILAAFGSYVPEFTDRKLFDKSIIKGKELFFRGYVIIYFIYLFNFI